MSPAEMAEYEEKKLKMRKAMGENLHDDVQGDIYLDCLSSKGFIGWTFPSVQGMQLTLALCSESAFVWWNGVNYMQAYGKRGSAWSDSLPCIHSAVDQPF